MKILFISYNLFQFIILFIIISQSNSILSFIYPSAIELPNGNIFVIEKLGIYVCDSSLINIIRTEFTFSEEDQIKNEDDLSRVIIKKTRVNSLIYILSLVNYKIYIFDFDGKLIYNSEEKIITGQIPKYYTLAPITIKDNIYYYIIGYFDENNYLNLLLYKYDNHQNTKIVHKKEAAFKMSKVDNYYNFKNNGLSCEFIYEYYYHYNRVLVCFFVISNGRNDFLIQNYYTLTIKEIQNNYDYDNDFFEVNNINFIKSDKTYDKDKVLVCFILSDMQAYCEKFYIYKDSGDFYTKIIIKKKCRDKIYGMKVDYLNETKEVSFSCSDSDGSIQVALFDRNLETPSSSLKQFTDCETIYGYSILYISGNKDYYVISDVNCNGNQKPFVSLINGLGEIIELSDLENKKEDNKIEEVEKEKEFEEEELFENKEEKEKEVEKEKEEENEIETIITKIEEILEKEENEEETYEMDNEEEAKIDKGEEHELEEKEINLEKEGFIEEEMKPDKEEKEEILYEEERENYEKIIENQIDKENIEEKEKENNEEELDSMFNCLELEKCSECNKESFSNNLCIKCNNQKGYYFLNTFSQLNHSNNQYIDCANELTKPKNYYFDEEKEVYELCYESCATCIYRGDGNVNNCTSCEENYIKKPEDENSTNCVLKCKYLYYYTNYNQYKCTSLPICSQDYYLIIKKKDKCVNNCMNDDIYKFQYNGECLKECPENTKNDSDHLCKDIDLNKCILSEEDFISLKEDNITDDEIEKLAGNFAKEFTYTNNHISVFKNSIYSITLYKNGDCIHNLFLQIPEIDFGECYQKVKNYFEIENNLVIAILDKKIEGSNYHKMISYSFFDPNNGDKLPTDTLCQNDKVVIQESILNKLDDTKISIDSILYLTGQNINIFNLSSEFYTDICYHYESKIDKDIALKDRILMYFPNISLCESNCIIKGINITSLKTICECIFNNLKANNFLTNNIIYQNNVGQIEEMISNTNIVIIKCYKDVFKYKFFIKNVGGFIILSLIFIQLIITIVYCSTSLYFIRKYIFNITNKYLVYLSSQKNNNILSNYLISFDNNSKKNVPPKKKSKINEVQSFNEIGTKINIKRKKRKGKTSINRKVNFSFKNKENFIKQDSNNNIISNNYSNDKIQKNNNILISYKNSGNEQNSKNDNNLILSNNKNNSINNSLDNNHNIRKKSKKRKSFKKRNKKLSFYDFSNLSNDPLNKYKLSDEKSINTNIFVNLKEDININIEEYLESDIDDLDYNDAIKKDKREFCNYFRDKLKSNQIILNTFCFEEPFKPRSIKLLLFIVDIDLYFFVNGLFYNEEYVSEIFHLEEDSFYNAFERFMGNFFYAALVGVIVNYIIEFFFIEEKKIKGILKREKDNLYILKFEIVQVIKDIRKRLIYFIVISYLITIFSWYHISCFNNVYPHMKNEWLIFSIIIIFLMQILSILACFIETILRFISFKYKSEKIYKLSLLLS